MKKQKVYKYLKFDNNNIYPSDPYGSLDDFFHSFEIQKIYKGIHINNINMHPSDPSGSPDEFFYSNSIVQEVFSYV